MKALVQLAKVPLRTGLCISGCYVGYLSIVSIKNRVREHKQHREQVWGLRCNAELQYKVKVLQMNIALLQLQHAAERQQSWWAAERRWWRETLNSTSSVLQQKRDQLVLQFERFSGSMLFSFANAERRWISFGTRTCLTCGKTWSRALWCEFTTRSNIGSGVTLMRSLEASFCVSCGTLARRSDRWFQCGHL